MGTKKIEAKVFASRILLTSSTYLYVKDEHSYFTLVICLQQIFIISGVFGPQSTLNLDIVQSITDRKDIPHILTRWTNPSQIGLHTINFFPNPDRLADGFLDIVKALEWNSFTILYTDAENLLQINEFIRKAKDDGIIVYLENVDPLYNGDFRYLL